MTYARMIEAPNGTLIRAAHVVAVSPIFESTELGTDAFAVYVVGSDEPFVFASETTGTKRKEETAKARQQFIDDWVTALDSAPIFSKN